MFWKVMALGLLIYIIANPKRVFHVYGTKEVLESLKRPGPEPIYEVVIKEHA